MAHLGLKSNLTKCRLAGIEALKVVLLAVCGMKYFDLRNKASKVLGTSRTTT